MRWQRQAQFFVACLYLIQSFFGSMSAARDPFHPVGVEPSLHSPKPPLRSGIFKLAAQEITIVDLLRKIAAAGGSNMMIDPQVTGSMSVHFEGVPWQEALNAVIQKQGLSLEERGAVLWVGVKALPLEQIRLKARIVELTDQATQALGLELNQSFGLESNMRQQHPFALMHIQDQSHRFQVGWNYLPVGFHLDLELALLETEGRAHVISSPELLVLNHEQAWIHQGKEIPYMMHTREERGVFFKKAVLSLKVTPHVISPKYTKLSLEVNKDGVSLEQSGSTGIPIIDTRQLSTTVVVQNDQTIVLGGIVEMSSHEHRAYLPGLRDLPGLSWLLGREDYRLNKKEVMLFLTVSQDRTLDTNEI